MHAGLVRALRHPVTLILAVGLLIGAFTLGRVAAATLADAPADQALAPAISAYLRDQASPLADQVTVQITDRAGAFVRGTVLPADQTTYDSATVFAKRNGDTWTILSIGTAFLPEDCTALEIPATLPCH